MKKMLLFVFVLGLFFVPLEVNATDYVSDGPFPRLWYWEDGELLATGFNSDMISEAYLLIEFHDMYHEVYNTDIDIEMYEVYPTSYVGSEDLTVFMGLEDDEMLLPRVDEIGFVNFNNMISLHLGTPSPTDIYITGFSVSTVSFSFNSTNNSFYTTRVLGRNLFKNMVSSYFYTDIGDALNEQYQKGYQYAKNYYSDSDSGSLIGFIPSVVGSMFAFFVSILSFDILGFSLGSMFFLSALLVAILWILKAIRG